MFYLFILFYLFIYLFIFFIFFFIFFFWGGGNFVEYLGNFSKPLRLLDNLILMQ